MTGDVANGPARGYSRPPLPRAPNRSRKQREREEPDVDWARSLQHFAAAVSDDLDELHARFVSANDVTFAAWKRLWADARMSAAFHVEFWESSPTDTHKTILQQALDALVCCIEERDDEFEREADVAALIGRVFALYCAYSVQLGDPKHKIDVDPQAWSTLLSVNLVVCGVGATLYPTAAREVRVMMHRLVVEEDAFLRCLEGFGPHVRVRKRTVRALDAGGAQDADDATEEDPPVKQTIVEQLKSRNARYQDLMSRTRSAGRLASSADVRLGGRRDKPALSASQLSTPEDDGDELVRALKSFLEYKTNEEARKSARIARAAAAREQDSRNMLEQVNREHEDRGNGLELSDRGSVRSVPPSPTAESVASTRDVSHSESSEDFLAELESELHADISSDHVEPATDLATQSSARSETSEVDGDALADLERELEHSVELISSRTGNKADSRQSSSPARRKQGRPAAALFSRKTHQAAPKTTLAPPDLTAEHHEKQSSAISDISEADSDALADLERELEQSVALVSSQTRKTEPARSKRGREPAATGIVPRKSARTAASTQKPAHNVTVDNARSAAKRESASRLSFADSWAADSVTDSDGLAEIQAELDAIPTIAGSLQAAPESFPRDLRTQQRSSGPVLVAAQPKTKPKKAKRSSRQPGVRMSQRLKSSAVDVQSMDQPSGRRARALSAVSDNSELLAQLETELDFSAGPLGTTTTSGSPNTRNCSIFYQTSLRRSSRLSSSASDADSNAFEELERELHATSATLGALPSVAAPIKTRARKREAEASKRPVERSTRSNTKKQRPNETDMLTAAAVHQPPAGPTASKTVNKQRASTQERLQVSLLSSDTESDGMADLVAELDTIVASTAVQHKRNPPAKRPNSSSTSRKKSLASPKVVSSRSTSLRPTRSMAPVAVVGLRRSSRLSSLASDTDSDGLADLMAELESTPAASQFHIMKTTKPRTRAGTRNKQPSRAQGTQSRQNQAKVRPKATRAPRAPRQRQTKRHRAVVEKAAAKPSTRQPPVNLPSTRRSTRSSSVVFDSESDGLAELEAELQAGPT